MADQTFTYSFDVLGIPGDAARLEAAVAAQISRQMGIDASQLKVTAQYASAYAAGVIGPTPPLTMATDVPPLPEPPPKPTQADKDARWLRAQMKAAGDSTAETAPPQHGFRMDKTQAEADAAIAAALQARIDGKAAYMTDPFQGHAVQMDIPDDLRPRRMRTPEEIAEVMNVGAPFHHGSPVSRWLHPDAAADRAAYREKAAEEKRLQHLLALAPAIESMHALFSSDPRVWDVPAAPAEPTTPGSGLKALRKATNRKAHWLK